MKADLKEKSDKSFFCSLSFLCTHIHLQKEAKEEKEYHPCVA